LFSVENSTGAVRELAHDLVGVISGIAPVTFTVQAEPGEAAIFINETFAGTGEISNFEHSPGEVSVVVSANKYETVSAVIELNEGEQTEVSFTLPLINFTPLSLTALVPEPKSKWAVFTPTRFSEQGAAVYQGALYVGQTPLILDARSDMFNYFRIESDQTGSQGTIKKTAGTVVVDGRQDIVSVKTRVLPAPGQKPVEKSRNRMYTAYGLFWLALPLAIVAGIGGSDGMAGAAIKGRSQDAYTWYPVSIGASIAAGTALGFFIFNAARYFSTANNNSPPLSK
jgi:hypothetical protein